MKKIIAVLSLLAFVLFISTETIASSAKVKSNYKTQQEKPVVKKTDAKSENKSCCNKKDPNCNKKDAGCCKKEANCCKKGDSKNCPMTKDGKCTKTGTKECPKKTEEKKYHY